MTRSQVYIYIYIYIYTHTYAVYSLIFSGFILCDFTIFQYSRYTCDVVKLMLIADGKKNFSYILMHKIEKKVACIGYVHILVSMPSALYILNLGRYVNKITIRPGISESPLIRLMSRNNVSRFFMIFFRLAVYAELRAVRE